MSRMLPIGIGAGLASAFLLLSASTGGLGTRILIYLLAPLPMVLAGLTTGALTAAIAALVAATTVLLMIGPKIAIIQALSHGIPVTVLCHLALLSRTVPGVPAGEASTVEWYPLGRIVAAATLMAGALGFITTIMLGADLDEQRKMLRQLIDTFFERMPQMKTDTLGEAEMASMVEAMLYALPGASALSWLLGTLLNLYIGARVAALSGLLARPLPDVPTMSFPPGFGLGLAAALPMTFVGGTIGFVGSGFAGAFFAAHLLMGLAIIHDISRGSSGRPLILGGLYILLAVLNTWIALGLALFALLAPVLPLRRGNPPGGPSPGPD